jgi:hypothetical protein
MSSQALDDDVDEVEDVDEVDDVRVSERKVRRRLGEAATLVCTVSSTRLRLPARVSIAPMLLVVVNHWLPTIRCCSSARIKRHYQQQQSIHCMYNGAVVVCIAPSPERSTGTESQHKQCKSMASATIMMVQAHSSIKCVVDRECVCLGVMIG